jgi:hypothetical protein
MPGSDTPQHKHVRLKVLNLGGKTCMMLFVEVPKAVATSTTPHKQHRNPGKKAIAISFCGQGFGKVTLG